MTVVEKQQQLARELGLIEDRHERLSAIVDRARRIPPLPPAERTDAHRVKSCQSRVWVVGAVHDGRLDLRFDAESPVVKGLVALLCEAYDRAKLDDVVATEPTVLADLDLLRELSPTRRNGLHAVRAHIKHLAESHRSPSPAAAADPA